MDDKYMTPWRGLWSSLIIERIRYCYLLSIWCLPVVHHQQPPHITAIICSHANTCLWIAKASLNLTSISVRWIVAASQSAANQCGGSQSARFHLECSSQSGWSLMICGNWISIFSVLHTPSISHNRSVVGCQNRWCDGAMGPWGYEAL